jgi:hypothetical protein
MIQYRAGGGNRVHLIGIAQAEISLEIIQAFAEAAPHSRGELPALAGYQIDDDRQSRPPRRGGHRVVSGAAITSASAATTRARLAAGRAASRMCSGRP